MSSPPTGTVTFLFTDIEGSTKLAQAHGAAWPALQGRHHAILRSAIEAHGGHVFKTVGDESCAAFASASDALAAAAQSQRDLAELPLKVRMGLHTGAATARSDGDYEGYLALATVQRVMSVAYGAQTLVSSATAGLLSGQLPEGLALRDMGEHRLKGLLNPERLWQVVAPDLPADFPALGTLNAVPNNLLIQPTSFIGREKEIAEVKQLLAATHLLTLTGSGGTGKTRLSLQVAAEVLDTFKDGVWFVEFAPLSDPALVPNTVASVLGLREEQGRPLMATLMDWLRPKQLMLILDNCEHLIDSCARFADAVLHACHDARILASSREALGIGGELAFRVPSLEIPDLKDRGSVEELMRYASVRLFVERAAFALPTFSLTDTNSAAVVQICQRLDGIPLAIELAAARVKALRVEQVAARLDDRFRLLTVGSRTALPRQQTLRATIDWSYDLLSEAERVLLWRLAVFAGGWTLDAAEQLCGFNPLSAPAILDLLTHLVDKSLVMPDEQSPDSRYRMLEMIRHYGREKLDTSGERDVVEQQHLAVLLKFAEEVEPQLQAAQQVIWYNRLESEHGNIRVALNRAIQANEIVEGLRLASALGWFWLVRNHHNEGIRYLQSLLGHPAAQMRRVERAKALNIAGLMHIVGTHQYNTAHALLKEALSIGQELVSPGSMALSHLELGIAGTNVGELRQARTHLEEALSLGRQVGDCNIISHSLRNLGEIAHQEGDSQKTKRFYEESLAVARQCGDLVVMGRPLRGLAELAIQDANYEQARLLYEESLTVNAQLGDNRGTAGCLAGIAHLAIAKGQLIRATTLCAAVESLLQAIHTPLLFIDEVLFEQSLASLHLKLNKESFDRAWIEGSKMAKDQAITYALGNDAQ